jgi:hypothetical protein
MVTRHSVLRLDHQIDQWMVTRHSVLRLDHREHHRELGTRPHRQDRPHQPHQLLQLHRLQVEDTLRPQVVDTLL